MQTQVEEIGEKLEEAEHACVVALSWKDLPDEARVAIDNIDFGLGNLRKFLTAAKQSVAKESK
jgi:hypothetical protein